MRLQAPENAPKTFNSKTFNKTNSSASKHTTATRFGAGVAGPALAAGLLGIGLLTGCGSGVVNTAQQALAVPVASAKGPQLGYLWMASDRTLRPILGVPGSSQVGQSVVPAGVYSSAASSATASIAVLQDAGGAFDLMALPSGSPVSLGVTLPVGARIRLSPSAAAALLYTPGASSASLVTGLPSAPLVRTVDAPAAMTDSAVSDTGAVGFEYAQGPSLAVSVTGADGRSTAIGTVRGGGGLSFLPGRDDLLFADGAANSLTLVRSATSAPSVLAIPTQLLKKPTALGVSGSGRWALVVNGPGSASSGSQTAVRVDLTTLATTQLTCNCSATVALPLADDGAFRLTDAANGPNWMADAAQATPRTLFIPALPSSAKTTLVAAGVVP
jgi:hypothetical protein